MQFWEPVQSIRDELLFFSAVWFLVGAADELLVDMLWLLHRLQRWLQRYRIVPPQRTGDLAAPARPGMIAIFIAAWSEAAVIGQMLHRCHSAWGGGETRYRIYIGCYPNDGATIDAVRRAADPACRIILCDKPGPTTKADCLNRLWRALVADELAGGFKAKAIVLHDAEDYVHADEIRVFDLLIEKATAVQLPVIPMQVAGSAWISGHYCDEFAEAHGKTLVVREAIGTALPLAGVGCAIERNQLGRIALERAGAPFDDQSLTEDYELGLNLSGVGRRTIFARIYDANQRLVGTRACFPDTLTVSVRQKTRWMIGIALAGWDRLGWSGGTAECWMRLRDRKSVLAAIVLSVAYVCVVLTALLMLAERAELFRPTAIDPMLVKLLAANAVFLLWRIIVRAYFVWRIQGWCQALLSIPRTLIANIISIIAARRAVTAYVGHLLGKALNWDKTNHSHFPNVKSTTR